MVDKKMTKEPSTLAGNVLRISRWLASLRAENERMREALNAIVSHDKMCREKILSCGTTFVEIARLTLEEDEYEVLQIRCIELEFQNQRLREALEKLSELEDDLPCICHEGWTSRMSHGPDCYKHIGRAIVKITQEALKETEEKK